MTWKPASSAMNRLVRARAATFRSAVTVAAGRAKPTASPRPLRAGPRGRAGGRSPGRGPAPAVGGQLQRLEPGQPGAPVVQLRLEPVAGEPPMLQRRVVAVPHRQL